MALTYNECDSRAPVIETSYGRRVVQNANHKRSRREVAECRIGDPCPSGQPRTTRPNDGPPPPSACTGRIPRASANTEWFAIASAVRLTPGRKTTAEAAVASILRKLSACA